MPFETAPDGQPAPRDASPTRATIWFDGAPVTLLPKRAPVGNSGPVRGRTLAIFPALSSPTMAAPEAAPVTDARLRAAIPERHHDLFRATVGPGGQPALAVADLTEAEAVATGRTLGLDSILFWDGRRARLLACNA